MEPIVDTRKATREFDGWSNRTRSEEVVVVVAKHSESVQFQLSVLETQVAADAIEGFFDGWDPWNEQAVLVLLILAVVIQESYSDGSMIARTGRTCRLDGIAAFGIALQVKLLGEANVNVLGTPRRRSDIAAVSYRNGPIEIAVVRCTSELDPALWRPKYRLIVCGKARSRDRKSTRLNSSHPSISYAVFCLKKK